MNINAVCEKPGQAKALAGISGISRIFHPKNTMPYVFRNRDGACRSFLDEPFLLVRSMDEIGYLKENGYDGEIFADHTLYTFNPSSRALLFQLGIKHDTAPLELNFSELKARGMNGSDIMIYGRVPMMISAGCIYRNAHDDKCDKNIRSGHQLILTDRLDADFPVMCVCRYCYNIILNSVPLSLHGHMDKLMKLGADSLRLYFTTESEKETASIAGYFLDLIKEYKNGGNASASPPYTSFTKGHFIKGAE